MSVRNFPSRGFAPSPSRVAGDDRLNRRVAVVFHRLGPYHWARLEAATRVAEISAIEFSAETAVYAWDKLAGPANFKRITLIPDGDSRHADPGELAARLEAALDSVRPELVAIPGWSDTGAFAALRWCLDHQCPALVMSESTPWDEKRVFWKEWVKRRIVRLYAAALVGGKPHADYMAALGMPREQIFPGYDAVDNGYFAGKVASHQMQEAETRKKFGLPEKYFLASARFVANKNLARLLEAYASYRQQASKAESGKQKAEIWDLVLLGDGPLRETLNSQLSTLNLHGHVQLPGFKQYRDLPTYYALANVFIHASTTEPWGLVVNEAMASGLPVLVSHRCGCASDLVDEGVNGFTFDPLDTEGLARLMLKISAFYFPLSQFGAESARIIAHWGVDGFASNLGKAVACSLEQPTRAASAWERLLLCALIHYR